MGFSECTADGEGLTISTATGRDPPTDSSCPDVRVLNERLTLVGLHESRRATEPLWCTTVRDGKASTYVVIPRCCQAVYYGNSLDRYDMEGMRRDVGEFSSIKRESLTAIQIASE